VFCEASGEIVSDHKINYWLVGLEDHPMWFPAAWRFVQPGVIVWYLGIPFGVDISRVAMWDWCLERLQCKLLFWQCKDLPFVAKLMVVRRILQASHIYYVSCWLPSKVQVSSIGTIFTRTCGPSMVGLMVFPWSLG
jgi:hypothetical protein